MENKNNENFSEFKEHLKMTGRAINIPKDENPIQQAKDKLNEFKKRITAQDNE